MIEVRVGRLEDVAAEAVLCPVSSDFSPVNPAMSRFQAASGPAVAAQCRQLGELPLGSAVITAGGDLHARFIVHAAVRSATENVSPSVVGRALVNGLRRLEEWGVEDVVVAPFGTGAGNLDAEESAAAMVPRLAEHLRTASHPTRVVLVVEDEYQRSAFDAALRRASPDRVGTET